MLLKVKDLPISISICLVINKYVFIIFLLILFSFKIEAYNITVIDMNNKRSNDLYEKVLEDPSTIRAIFVGDILMSRYVKESVQDNFNGDYRELFTYVYPFFNGADIIFGNLENPITDKKMTIADNLVPIIQHPLGGFHSITNVCCSFGAEVQTLDALKWMGFNVLNIANNHVGDAGIAGIEDTVINLKNAGINYVGGGLNAHEAHSPYIFIKGNVRIGILGYSKVKSSKIWESDEFISGISIYKDEDVKKDIMLTKDSADIVVVSMHFGNEGDVSPDNTQVKAAHLMIDSGASIVIGHHPHVIQPVEVYKGGVIAYSLGNFVFDEDRFDKSNGLLLEVLIVKPNLYIIPRQVIINYAHQPVIQF